MFFRENKLKLSWNYHGKFPGGMSNCEIAFTLAFYRTESASVCCQSICLV